MSKEERQELPLQYYNVLKKIEDEEARPHNVKEVGKNVKVYYIKLNYLFVSMSSSTASYSSVSPSAQTGAITFVS